MPLTSFTFIDMGSGRGRMLLLASQRSFRRIIGVEFAVELHKTALENIRRFPKERMACEDVTALYGDAATFVFPLEPLIVYFYNPFSEVIMEQVVGNLSASYAQQPRAVIVVYAQQAIEDPRHTTYNVRLLDQQRFLHGRTLRSEKLSDHPALRQYLVRIYYSREALDLSD